MIIIFVLSIHNHERKGEQTHQYNDMAYAMLSRRRINMVWCVILVVIVLTDWSSNVSTTRHSRAEAIRLDLGLPGGGRLSYRDGLLRIQSPPSAVSKAVLEVPWDELKPKLSIENKLSPGKGFGAFYTGIDPLPEGSFLGLYEGKLVSSRESLDEMHISRKKELRDSGLEDDANKVSDYVLSLDGGAHFLDGFDLRYQGDPSMAFALAHLNHSPKEDLSCNVMRKLVYLPDDVVDDEHYPRNLPRIAFFAAREIATGEELAFDYGTNFWKRN